jgi:hypothetical protein
VRMESEGRPLDVFIQAFFLYVTTVPPRRGTRRCSPKLTSYGSGVKSPVHKLGRRARLKTFVGLLLPAGLYS